MGKIVDMIGQRFGEWEVICLTEHPNPKPNNNPAYWLCKCSCGTEKAVCGISLRNGSSTSCGCNRKYNRLIHGETGSRLFSIWNSMRDRGLSLTRKNYEHVTLDENWNDYTVFKEWALNNGYNETLSIDRINSNSGYSPKNCRWVNQTIQARNKRKNPKASSKYYGVVLTKSGTYQALVQIKGKKVFCKTFKDEILAAKARDEFIIKNNLEGYTLNF
jgi:hypothetical protein